MQIAFNTYSTAKAQETIIQAKLFSKTPAFTNIQNSTVPVKPSGPKRLFMAIIMAFLCFFVEATILVVKGVKKETID